MKSTHLPLSNEKQRVELPSTTALYPTGTTINNAGKPLVFHPQAGKMSVGEFPTPDGSYLRYRTITAGQVQDIYTDPDTPSFQPGWVYAVEGQNPGLIVMQAVGARSLDVKNAWQVTQVPQQGGGSVEVANPVFYDVDTDTITARVIDDSNYAKLNQRNQFTQAQVITNDSLTSNKAQTLTVTDKAASVQNSSIATFLTPNVTDNIFLTIGAQAGQSGLFGYSKEGGVSAVFMTTYGRPASDFKILGTNGYVGMGTSTPTQKLTIVEGNAEIRLGSGCSAQTPAISVINTAGGKAAGLLAGTTGTGFYFDENGVFTITATPHYAFTDNRLGCVPSIDAVTIKGDGKVGVGVSKPTEKFEVNGTAKADVFYALHKPTSTSISIDGKTIGWSNESGNAYIDYNLSTGGLEILGNYLSVSDPVAPQNVATKGYVDQAVENAGSSGPTTPTGHQIFNAGVFTASADGAQTIPLAAAPRGIVSVTCFDQGTQGTRIIWEPYCTISGTNLILTTDASIYAGDKILAKYYV